MSSIFDIFKPAPFIARIPDKEVVEEKYHYWRIRTLYSTFLGYAFYYFSRNNLKVALPEIMNDLHFDKSQLGFLTSVFAITYGSSKFINGYLGDRLSPRYFMAFGLMLTGIVNICFGLSSSLLMFSIFWGLNGYFQGFGWPPCAKFLTQWYSHSERGSWWSTWNVSHNVGAFTIPYIAGAAMYYYGGWRSAMYVPGILCILGGLFLINRLRDTPQSIGLPPIEEFRDDYGSSKVIFEEENALSKKDALIEYVFKNKYIWLLAFAYFFVYVIRIGMNEWTVLYLIEAKGYSSIGAVTVASFFDVGGFLGSLFAGWSSDRLFGARRGPVNVIYAISIVLSITFFWMLPGNHAWLNSIAIFFVGFSIFGPQMMIGMVAAELAPKKAAATSNGFVGFFAYLGAAIAGYPLGRITQEYGWEGFFLALFVCSIISLAFLLPLWGVTENDKKIT